MSKKDKTNTLIDCMLKAISLLVITLFGLVGYLFINVEELDNIRLIAIGISIFVITLAIIFILKALMKKINELEDL